MKQEMKKTLLSTLVLAGVLASAQVGINTEDPKATLEIKANTKDPVSGLLIPKVTTTERNAFIKPEQGLLVYNTDLKCHEMNVGSPATPEWECIATAKNVQTVSIEPVGFIGNFRYRGGNHPDKNKVIFKVTNNTSSELTGIDLSFVKVEGVAQYVDFGQNDNVTIPANSSVDLTYGISGSNWSDAVFTLAYDKYSTASFVLHIDKSFSQGEDEALSSGDGGTADFGVMKSEYFLVKDNTVVKPINKSLTISASNPLIVEIPFTNGTGNYIAYTSPEVSIRDANGVDRKIKLSYTEGNLDIGKGNIQAKIESSDGNDLILPQTTLGEKELIAKIPIKLNGKEKGTFDLYVFGGIPDKRFKDSPKHKFVYMPVVSPSGRTWLNNNLGAEYNKITSQVFDANQQAKSMDDVYAYGSRFQYHRAPDGHELTEILDDKTFKMNTDFTNELSSNFEPGHNKVINNKLSDEKIPHSERKYNWVEESYKNVNKTEWSNLWTVDGVNNPCPEGYRPPTTQELKKEMEYLPKLNKKGLHDSVLRLVSSNETLMWGVRGNSRLVGNPSSVYISANADQYRNHVRCIKHEN